MTNEEIIEKIRTTLAEEFEVGIDVIQPDAPLMETLELDSLDLVDIDRKSTRLNSSHKHRSRMPSSA